MRQTAGILRDAAVVGEFSDCLDVGKRRPAQPQPFGLEDANRRLLQRGGWEILDHSLAPSAHLRVKLKEEAGIPPPLGASWRSAGLTGPADSHCPPSIRPRHPSSDEPIPACGRLLWHGTRRDPRLWQTEYGRPPCRH